MLNILIQTFILYIFSFVGIRITYTNRNNKSIHAIYDLPKYQLPPLLTVYVLTIFILFRYLQ